MQSAADQTSDSTPLSAELASEITALSRALVAAARSWTLYPADHPAVAAAFARFAATIAELTRSGRPFIVAVAPDTLLVDGRMPENPERIVVEAAALLHERDILQLTFASEVPDSAIRAFLVLLGLDPPMLRSRGGPAHAWAQSGELAILIDQLDYKKVLEDHTSRQPVKHRDQLWYAIIRSIIERRKLLDEVAQQRLLEIAADPGEIGDLAKDVMSPGCTPDGSPMITTQAAAILAAFRQLANIVAVLAPERMPETMQNLALATSDIDSKVMVELLRAEDDAAGETSLFLRGLVGAFDETKVAQLLATAMAIQGQATSRLADVFETLAPDEERKKRVLSLTRTLLDEDSFGNSSPFESTWGSMEELLMTHSERRFVSTAYRATLDGVQARAGAVANQLPPEIETWMESIGHENVRQLSVRLMIDLFDLEGDADRSMSLVGDLETLAEELILGGEYVGAAELASALRQRTAGTAERIAAECLRALERLALSDAMGEAVEGLEDLDDGQTEGLQAICLMLGAGAGDALRPALVADPATARCERALTMLTACGPVVIPRLDPLVEHVEWVARRNTADLLGRLAASEGIPLLKGLLRDDPRVARMAVRSLATILDPAAARAIHIFLRGADEDQRAVVVGGLVDARDLRAVPVLIRILDESQPIGADHRLVLEVLDAAGVIASDRSIPAIARLMKRGRWWARRKSKTLKRAAIVTLQRIATPAATAALHEAARQGDRTTRRLAEAVLAG